MRRVNDDRDVSAGSARYVAAGAGSLLAAATIPDGALAAGEGVATQQPQTDALPSFRFALGEQKPTTYAGGYFREASVLEFPASENIAGVLVTLHPGGIRELHWHANATEWAYVISGHCRVSVTDPQGHCEITDFSAGDVWYFRAAMATQSRRSGPAIASSSKCSTTDTFPASRPSAAPTGSRTRRRRCWRRISACRLRYSPTSPSARCSSAQGRSRDPCRAIRPSDRRTLGR